MALDENNFEFSPNPSWSHCEWDYRIVEIEKNRFFAELLVLDEYDDYLMQWKVYETSPKFNTRKEASEYVFNHWHEKEV